MSLDVTAFGWPVGDHVWHRWDDTRRFLDWPEARIHRFIELDRQSLAVMAQQESHRPVRSSIPGRVVIDITGTPLEAFHGDLIGRFVPCDTGWRFEPYAGPLCLPMQRRLALSAVPLSAQIETRLWSLRHEPILASR